MTSRNESITLYSQKDGADKEYRIQLTETDGGFILTGFNGRRNGTLTRQPKIADPVDYEAAKREYDALLKKQLKKGYKPGQGGADYQDLPDVGVSLGIDLHLLKQVSEQEIERYLTDDAFVAQRKHDGERRPIVRRDNTVVGGNKLGFQKPLTVDMAKVLSALPEGTVLDTEHVGDTLYAFDVMEAHGTSLRASGFMARHGVLADLIKDLGEQSCVVVVEVAAGTAAKRAMYHELRASRAEGIVFKRRVSAYGCGENEDQIKIKFVESATVQVVSIHPSKRSIGFQVFTPAGEAVPIGNAKVPTGCPMPKVGDLVEIEYLYCVKRLVQAVFKGPRTDQTIDRCTTTQLKYREGIGDDEPIADEEETLLAA